MRRFIKFVLNHIPRPIVQRVANWAVPVLSLAYKGRGRECPICKAHYRKFMPYGYTDAGSRENALCPSCLSLERHRLLWLWLQKQSNLFETHPRILHIAPEVCLMRRFRKLYKECPGQYITADLESPLADLKMDIQAIPLADQSVDVIFCNHILEHVADDRLAMREMYRVMRNGGWGVMLSPVDLRHSKTTRLPTPRSAPESSDNTTTVATTVLTMPTVCARRVSRSKRWTTPRYSHPKSDSNTDFAPK